MDKDIYIQQQNKTNMSRYKQDTNIVMKAYPISVPSAQYGGRPCLFKVYFGRKYFIWKGKSLVQSCELLSKSIKSKLGKGAISDEDFLYHVMSHINKTRCIKATVDVISDNYTDGEKIDTMAILKDEQMALWEAMDDADCLNNNIQAYIPVNNSWISEATKNKFLIWYEKNKKK